MCGTCSWRLTLVRIVYALRHCQDQGRFDALELAGFRIYGAEHVSPEEADAIEAVLEQEPTR